LLEFKTEQLQLLLGLKKEVSFNMQKDTTVAVPQPNGFVGYGMNGMADWFL
jgi:ribosomal protein L6P/L9E